MVIPPKLKKGDEIRVVAPAKSLALISDENIELAKNKLEEIGLVVTFSKNCRESDIFNSSSIESRVSDLHDAFSDKNVKAIFSVIGGYSSNELLDNLDFELIKNNPKILCGYSDITALANAITAQTDLVTYSGPHFSTWAMKKEFDYILDYFKKSLIFESSFSIDPSKTWSDDAWYENQDNRQLEDNEGPIVINSGKAEGKVLGGNLCTFNLLHGTKHMPDLSDSVLFLEDDDLAGDYFAVEFNRNLQSLIQQPNFDQVKGLLIGKFQKKAKMNLEKIQHIIRTKRELQNIPVVVNVNFGHTYPIITFPIGGTVRIEAKENMAMIEILTH